MQLVLVGLNLKEFSFRLCFKLVYLFGIHLFYQKVEQAAYLTSILVRLFVMVLDNS